jgi:hypothetical protein
VRALNPLAAADAALLEAVNRAEFMIAGFRNRDIRGLLFPGPEPDNAAERKRQAAKVPRLFRLLRGHGLIARVPKTHRYQVTQAGRVRIGALLAARHADTKRLPQAV